MGGQQHSSVRQTADTNTTKVHAVRVLRSANSIPLGVCCARTRQKVGAMRPTRTSEALIRERLLHFAHPDMIFGRKQLFECLGRPLRKHHNAVHCAIRIMHFCGVCRLPRPARLASKTGNFGHDSRANVLYPISNAAQLGAAYTANISYGFAPHTVFTFNSVGLLCVRHRRNDAHLVPLQRGAKPANPNVSCTRFSLPDSPPARKCSYAGMVQPCVQVLMRLLDQCGACFRPSLLRSSISAGAAAASSPACDSRVYCRSSLYEFAVTSTHVLAH